MKIIVGSTSKSKLNAVKAAFPVAEVIGVEVASGVPAQPIHRQTWDGAKNRAINAKNQIPDADLYIGIENGIFEKYGNYFDMAAICWMSKEENYKTHFCFSEQIAFDSVYVEEAKVRGLNETTVGMVMKEKGVIADAADPHLSLTGKSREQYLKSALSKIPGATLITSNPLTNVAILAGTALGFFGIGYLVSKIDISLTTIKPFKS